MDLHRIAAFTYAGRGGNPAGVALCERLPSARQMQALAADIGYSETVFAAPLDDSNFKVRYFAPQAEVAFCGHATIALGAVLATVRGDGTFHLQPNDGGVVVVEGWSDAEGIAAAFRSPPTCHAPASVALHSAGLALFGLWIEDLDPAIPVAVVEAGVRHLLLPLLDRGRLSAMRYDMAAGATLMRDWNLATVSLVQAERPNLYHARNPFAVGGVYEDPATGAGAAALAAYLGTLGIADAAGIEIVQGEDMGVPCLLHAAPPLVPHGGARVMGRIRRLDGPIGAVSPPA